MIPVEKQPIDFMETTVGVVEKVQFLNGELAIKLRVTATNINEVSNTYKFNVSNKYVWKILLQQLGSLVYEDGILNFNLLLNHLLILSFTNVNGTYKWYRNLTSIIVADLLMEVVEEE